MSSDLNIKKFETTSGWGDHKVLVNGTLLNRSDDECDFEVRIEFRSRQGAPLHSQRLEVLGVAPWQEAPWKLEGRTRDDWPRRAKNINVTHKVLKRSSSEDAPDAKSTYLNSLPAPNVPIAEWRGNRYKTTRLTLPAKCRDCDNFWEVAGAATNELANYQSRLAMHGPDLSEVRNFHSSSQPHRDYADVQEREREQRRRTVYAKVNCPSCKGTNVLFARIPN